MVYLLLNFINYFLIVIYSVKWFTKVFDKDAFSEEIQILERLRRELDSFGGYFSVKGNEKHFAIQIYMETIVGQ